MKERAQPLLYKRGEAREEAALAREGERESYGQMLYELATVGVGIGVGGVGDRRLRQSRPRSKERCVCLKERARGERVSKFL
jgi:hypothetical protein